MCQFLFKKNLWKLPKKTCFNIIKMDEWEETKSFNSQYSKKACSNTKWGYFRRNSKRILNIQKLTRMFNNISKLNDKSFK